MVGMNGSIDFLENTFQNLFQSSDWESIINNHQIMTISFSNVSKFLFNQLAFEAAKDEECRKVYTDEIESLRSQLVFMQIFYS